MEEEVGLRAGAARSDAERVLRELENRGLLLLQDKEIPNAVTLLAGETVRGSWWGHRRSHEIFRVLTEVGASPDVLSCKLVSGKVTLVHRRLWAALLAVATSGERWQTETLSRDARSQLRRVRGSDRAASSGAAIKELERRLLVHAEEEHTDTGAHRLVAETWETWARRMGGIPTLSPAEGKRRLEKSAAALGVLPESLPWNANRRPALAAARVSGARRAAAAGSPASAGRIPPRPSRSGSGSRRSPRSRARSHRPS